MTILFIPLPEPGVPQINDDPIYSFAWARCHKSVRILLNLSPEPGATNKWRSYLFFCLSQVLQISNDPIYSLLETGAPNKQRFYLLFCLIRDTILYDNNTIQPLGYGGGFSFSIWNFSVPIPVMLMIIWLWRTSTYKPNVILLTIRPKKFAHFQRERPGARRIFTTLRESHTLFL